MAATLYASRRRAGQYIGLIDTPPYIQHDESRVNSVLGSGGSTNMLVSSMAAAMTERVRSPPMSRPDSATVRPPIRCVASCSGAIAHSTDRTSSTSERPTVNSEAATSTSRRRPSSLAARASPSRSWSRNTSTSRSRILATNWSCSYCARSTHSTSSNSRSSWLDGVNRCRLSSGRCTITFRSRPTSEWTPNVVISPPFHSVDS